MTYLLDTNIFLEILLDQQNSDDAEKMLKKIPSTDLYLSDFSLYSIGIILFRNNQKDTFVRFTEDLLIKGSIEVISLSPADFQSLIDYSKRFSLDFDDAYQYTLLEKHGLNLVSFDQDFDITGKSRLEPGELLSN